MNLGRLVLRIKEPVTSPLPCTPRACIDLLQHYQVPLQGAQVCVVGRGTTVGRSLPLMLTRKDINATVTCCHTGTRDLAAHTRAADVIVACAGSAGIIKPEMVKEGAAVLDVGVSRGAVNPETGKARLEGDVAEGVDEVAGWLSPNPGGIGPMTRLICCSMWWKPRFVKHPNIGFTYEFERVFNTASGDGDYLAVAACGLCVLRPYQYHPERQGEYPGEQSFLSTRKKRIHKILGQRLCRKRLGICWQNPKIKGQLNL